MEVTDGVNLGEDMEGGGLLWTRWWTFGFHETW